MDDGRCFSRPVKLPCLGMIRARNKRQSLIGSKACHSWQVDAATNKIDVHNLTDLPFRHGPNPAGIAALYPTGGEVPEDFVSAPMRRSRSKRTVITQQDPNMAKDLAWQDRYLDYVTIPAIAFPHHFHHHGYRAIRHDWHCVRYICHNLRNPLASREKECSTSSPGPKGPPTSWKCQRYAQIWHA